MPPTRRRLTVDPDRFALAVLRANLPAEATVNRWRPNDFLQRLPFVESHITPGSGRGSVRDPGRMIAHRSVAELAVEVWAPSPRAASDLGDAVIAAFHRAKRSQRLYAGGHLADFAIPLSFGEVRDAGQPGRVVHFAGALELTLRPARY